MFACEQLLQEQLAGLQTQALELGRANALLRQQLVAQQLSPTPPSSSRARQQRRRQQQRRLLPRPPPAPSRARSPSKVPPLHRKEIPRAEGGVTFAAQLGGLITDWKAQCGAQRGAQCEPVGALAHRFARALAAGDGGCVGAALGTGAKRGSPTATARPKRAAKNTLGYSSALSALRWKPRATSKAGAPTPKSRVCAAAPCSAPTPTSLRIPWGARPGCPAEAQPATVLAAVYGGGASDDGEGGEQEAGSSGSGEQRSAGAGAVREGLKIASRCLQAQQQRQLEAKSAARLQAAVRGKRARRLAKARAEVAFVQGGGETDRALATGRQQAHPAAAARVEPSLVVPDGVPLSQQQLAVEEAAGEYADDFEEFSDG